MRAYDRDEYENWDEYEDDGEELQEEEVVEEEYEAEEEIHQPTQEELEYLGLRQRLKEAFRKKMKKESGSANSSSISRKNFPAKDNFGSFFGPSQPVIAQRVILESKSLLENPDLAARVFKSNNAKKLQKSNTSASSTVGSKPRPSGTAPKVTNGVKTKLQQLKNTRDYSFLLSDDAELPAPAKDRIPQKVSGPNSDARSDKIQPRIREPPSNSGRKVQDGREERKLKPSGHQAQGKMGTTQKLATVSKPKQASVDSKKQVPSSKGIGPGRPVEKSGPSKIPVGTIQKNVSAPSARSGVRHVQKPTTKLQPSASKPHVVQKRDFQESYQAKVLQKQPMPSSKSQMKQPQSRNSSRVDDERASRKPIRRDEPRRRYANDDDDEDPISMIRGLFNYNPRKYDREDDDISDMEANFDEILREEKRSSKIAKKEDDEALREIEEEERRERLRKEAKKRKLSQR